MYYSITVSLALFASRWFRTIALIESAVTTADNLRHSSSAGDSAGASNANPKGNSGGRCTYARAIPLDGFSLEGSGVVDRRIMLARIRGRRERYQRGKNHGSSSREIDAQRRDAVLLFLLHPSNYPCTRIRRRRRRRQLSSKRNFSFLEIFLGFSQGGFLSLSLSRELWIRLCRVQSVRIVVDACERLRKRWQDNGPFKVASFLFLGEIIN